MSEQLSVTKRKEKANFICIPGVIEYSIKQSIRRYLKSMQSDKPDMIYFPTETTILFL